MGLHCGTWFTVGPRFLEGFCTPAYITVGLKIVSGDNVTDEDEVRLEGAGTGRVLA